MRLPALALLWFIAVAGYAEHSPTLRGRLIYSDGNQITGQLIADGVFASDRFGEVRFQSNEARFEADAEYVQTARVPSAASPAETELAASQPPPDAGNPAPHTGKSSPRGWKFKLSGFLDRTFEDGDHKREYFVSLNADRPKQGADEFSARADYEYTRKHGRLDKRKATAAVEWRHDLGRSDFFTFVRPYAEYDGVNLSAAEALLFGRTRLNYFFALQQVGLGYRLYDSPGFTSSLVGSWNWFFVDLFDVLHGHTDAPSLLLENDLQLPWRFEFKQRAEMFHLRASGTIGWENRFDLTRRLTPHLFITLRHEYRRDYPVVSANRIDRLRLLFGAEF
ncbi:MAG: DUF481 domain-containing protein [Opitutaceae bacterium]|nr:DUF481 domain-containing protein [Opitutaceae bacterium]